MKQILQNLKTGEMEVAELPVPHAGPGEVLIRTEASLISAGTERMLVEFSRSSLIQKARQQPEKVQQVLNKFKTDGLLPTLEAVFRKLDEPMPLGYCNAGVVIETGADIHDLQTGDRVISNGPHAEIVKVPRRLCSRIPDGVDTEAAAFTVLGSIALQGIRLLEPTFGEKFVVFGMGLIGLITVQLLRANGCEVMAVDLQSDRLELAQRYGARIVDLSAGGDPVEATRTWTGEEGVDGVLITATAKTDEIIHQAAEVCRKRGRIILVGVVGLHIRRSDFYQKELSFQVSCSYGPGRYDERYEIKGEDYPLGFVRWTEQRNFDAILQALAAGQLQVRDLITDRCPIERAGEAYRKISEDPDTLGVILTYREPVERSSVVIFRQTGSFPAGTAVAGVIGAGNFSRAILLPALSRTGAVLQQIADLNPSAARYAARKFGAAQAVTDYRIILNDPEVNTVFIAVGHHLHARFVSESLRAGKHTFVEKPLALNEEELNAVIADYRSLIADQTSPLLLVGFNRRFSPHTVKIKELLRGRSGPLCLNITVNAGEIPADHWIQDPERGGGRIIGEGCHFIDLIVYLAGSPVTTVASLMVGEGSAVRGDKTSILLGLADGSIGTINYFANGPKSYPKEVLEVFSDGRVLRLNNFRTLRGYGFKGFRSFRSRRQDKGHRAEVLAFVDRAATGGEPLIPLEDLVNVTRASFAAVVSAREKRTINLAEEYSGTAVG